MLTAGTVEDGSPYVQGPGAARAIAASRPGTRPLLSGNRGNADVKTK